MAKDLIWEKYEEQKKEWPQVGRHVVAQFDEDSVVVYQAYTNVIGAYAVENKKFSGCSAFNEKRMTWIKTNFLWMMFRCGWGRKSGQQKVILAIWLKRTAFMQYLEQAVHSSFADDVYETKGNYKNSVKDAKKKKKDVGFVRLQWDPDHDPMKNPISHRRAIQLGLKGVDSYLNGDDILQIRDISEEIAAQFKFIGKRRVDPNLMTPREREFVIEENTPLYARLRISNNPHDHLLVDRKGSEDEDDDD
jgi:hypothetical protein